MEARELQRAGTEKEEHFQRRTIESDNQAPFSAPAPLTEPEIPEAKGSTDHTDSDERPFSLPFCPIIL
jgi:hypothetical protein